MNDALILSSVLSNNKSQEFKKKNNVAHEWCCWRADEYSFCF